MCLFNLVQQDYRVRLAPYGLGKLSALVVSYVSRRRAHQPAHSMPFLVFAHIYTGYQVLVVEQELGQGLCQFGLAHTGGTQEQERSYRPLLIGKAGTRAADGVGHGLDGLVLAHHSLVQLAFHSQELFLFALKHPVHGDACPAGNNLGNILGGHGLGDDGVLDGGHLLAQLFKALLGAGKFAVAKLGHLAVVAGALGYGRVALVVVYLLAQVVHFGYDFLLFFPALHQLVALCVQFCEFCLYLLHFQGNAFALDGLLLYLQLADPGVEVVYRLRDGVHLQAQLGGGLVHEVYGLVREETVVDVPVREVYGGYEGVVLYLHAVVVLVFLLYSPEDGDGFGRRRLVNHHLLESPLQGLVGLEVFLELVQGGGTYGAQLAPCQRRLEDVGCVHRARASARAHEGVYLVYEQDNLSVALHYFLYHALEPLLEFSLVFGSGYEGSHIKGEHFAGFQVLGDVAVHYLHCYAF